MEVGGTEVESCEGQGKGQPGRGGVHVECGGVWVLTGKGPWNGSGLPDP